jgi:hypothetical protein
LLAIENADPLADMTEDDLVDLQVEPLEGLRPHLLEPLAEVIVDRLGLDAIQRIAEHGAALTVLEGGA